MYLFVWSAPERPLFFIIIINQIMEHQALVKEEKWHFPLNLAI